MKTHGKAFSICCRIGVYGVVGLFALFSLSAGAHAAQAEAGTLDPEKRVEASAVAADEGTSAVASDVSSELLDLSDEEDADSPAPLRIADPIEPWNRAMFVFNDKCYFWLLKPIATGYKTVVPEMCRKGIRNFFHNLGMPVRLVGNTLQGKGKGALGEIGRFLYNTTVGVLGFGNPAAKYPALNPDTEDLGQTFGKYGIGHGIYLVWPIFGPSSIRETIGSVGDRFLSPVTYVEPQLAAVGVSAGDRINALSFHLGDYETFKAAAIDPYISARDVYLQYRKGKVDN